MSLVCLIPAVSINLKATPSIINSSSIASLVVPAISETMAFSSLNNELSNVDFPTLGSPIIATGIPFFIAFPKEKLSINFFKTEEIVATNSLNLVQDVLSSQLLFECGVAHVYLPGYHVGAQLTLSLPDMKEFVKGRGDIGNYLYELYTNNPLHKQRGVTDQTWRTWVIWDVINIAWMIEPSWVPSHVVSSPVLNNELYWRRDTESYPMREAYGVNRDAIFYDFFKKIDKLK